MRCSRYYFVYSAVRNADAEHPERAFAHAQQLIGWQRSLGIYHERAINEWAVGIEPLIIAANYFYGSLHFVVTIGVAVFLFRKWPDDYPLWRNTLAIATAIALIGFRFWPLMPPRLLPDHYGFVDTLDKYPTFWSFNSGAMKKISNQFAAMPSVHCCLGVVVRVRAGARLKTRRAKVLAVALPGPDRDRDRRHRQPLLPRRGRRLRHPRDRLRRGPLHHPSGSSRRGPRPNGAGVKLSTRVRDRLRFGAYALGIKRSRDLYRWPTDAWDREWQAGEWDYMTDVTETPRYSLLAGLITAGAPGRVLDIGCGTGTLRSYLRDDAFTGYRGFDLSETAVTPRDGPQLPAEHLRGRRCHDRGVRAGRRGGPERSRVSRRRSRAVHRGSSKLGQPRGARARRRCTATRAMSCTGARSTRSRHSSIASPCATTIPRRPTGRGLRTTGCRDLPERRGGQQSRPVTDLDHLAIATTDIDATLATLVADLGGQVIHGGDGYGFRWVQTRLGDEGAGMTIETLVVWQPEVDDFLARFVERHGGGAHHLTFKVQDLAATLTCAESLGLTPVGVNLDNPEWREAFLLPAQAHGTVVQLAQTQEHWSMAEILTSVEVDGPRATPHWWPNPPDRGPDHVTATHIVLGSPERDTTVAFFTELLGGEPVDHDGAGTDLRWPGGSVIRVEDHAVAGVLRLDAIGRTSRTIALSGLPVEVHRGIAPIGRRAARSGGSTPRSRALRRARLGPPATCGAFFKVASPNWRGGRSAIANTRSPSRFGGTAVSGSTAMPAPAATRSAISRMPSTSTGTSNWTPSLAAASSISARSGLTSGGSTNRRRARSEVLSGPGGRSASAGASPTIGSSARCSNTMRGFLGRRGDHRERQLLARGPPRATAPTRPRARADGSRALSRPQVGDELGHEPPARGAHDAERGVPHPESPERRDLLVQQLDLAPDPPGAVEHDPSRVRRRRPTATAGEERDAELGLELADLFGDVRLHGAQDARRRR